MKEKKLTRKEEKVAALGEEGMKSARKTAGERSEEGKEKEREVKSSVRGHQGEIGRKAEREGRAKEWSA